MTTYAVPTMEASKHKSTKSSVLKSFIHKRAPSSGRNLVVAELKDDLNVTQQYVDPDASWLPKDHPHSRALGELQHNQRFNNIPPKLYNGQHTSNIHDARQQIKSLTGANDEQPLENHSPKKTKSSANLAHLLTRPKSSRNLYKLTQNSSDTKGKDKENTKPVEAAANDPYNGSPPIYAQFSTIHAQDQKKKENSMKNDIDLYTPPIYTAGRQRDFSLSDDSQPSLNRRPAAQRPKSTYLPGNFTFQDLTRKASGSSRDESALRRRVSDSRRPSYDRKQTLDSVSTTMTNRGQRVLAALMPTSKSKLGVLESSPPPSKTPSSEDIEKEFEALLDRRNIPENQRWKMRGLALSMKKDFIRQDHSETAAKESSATKGSDSSAEPTNVDENELRVKKKRPRSRTFTLSRASIKDIGALKRGKTDTFLEASRQKPSDNARGTKSFTAASTVAQNMIAKAKGQLPDDFVAYLRKVSKPELVEVGRLHKLRLLLRNETVSWTDEFITLGGMEEIVGLLHRIMAVEWRYV